MACAEMGGRRSRVVPTPRRWRQLATMLRHSRGDGDNKPGSPGRARSKPLKPLRRECRLRTGEPVVTNSCAFYFAHEAAGAPAPGIPCALCFWRDGRFKASDATARREKANVCFEVRGRCKLTRHART